MEKTCKPGEQGFKLVFYSRKLQTKVTGFDPIYIPFSRVEGKVNINCIKMAVGSRNNKGTSLW